ncbi:hypothetical protein DsansV1_C01g0008301 [Dioscorea sansibarensis]
MLIVLEAHDNFVVTCHDVGVWAFEGLPFLSKNSIRVVCFQAMSWCISCTRLYLFLKHCSHFHILLEEMILRTGFVSCSLKNKILPALQSSVTFCCSNDVRASLGGNWNCQDNTWILGWP